MDNKRKTLTLGNKGSDIKSKVNFYKKNNENVIGSASDNKEVNDFFKKNTFTSNIYANGERKIVNLNAKKESPKPQVQEEVKNIVEEPKTLSIYQVLALEKKKKEEDDERRRQEEIAKKEKVRRAKQNEQLRQFNAKTKGEKVEGEDRPQFNRGGDRPFNKNKQFGEKREFNKDRPQGDKPSFNRDNNKPQGDRPPFNRNKFIAPAPIVVESQKKPQQKKDFSKDKDKKFKDFEESKRSSKKVVFLSNDDEDGAMARRKKKSFFKDKTQNTNQEKILHDVELPEFITVSDLADKMGEKRADVVKKLISMGVLVTINQTIDADTAELVITEFGHNVKKRTTEHDILNKLDELDEGKEFISRAPVVTIMGHVDHGKTSLLDAIRTTKVVWGESGGITQHIGASRVQVGNGKFITFIDTPGHEAFTEMRMRGANITDIVVLVVAADDGVKEQTIEAINHAKAAKVPIILAINKVDKQGANAKKVKEELLQYDIVIEEFGGEVMAVEVSAKEKIGLEKLKETILLQAEIMNLKSPIDVKSAGVVIESRMEQNRGAVATLLVQKGILREGDLILAGTSMGRIKRMIDDKKKTQKHAEPSMAVEILGLNEVPVAGDLFNVVESDKEAREIIAYRERKTLENKVAKRNVKSLDSMLKSVSGKSAKLLPVIIKADVNGSIEAISNTLTKLNTSEVEIDILHATTGAINANDVNLANVSNALILGFNVRASGSIVDLAKEKGIDIRYYSIIYNIVDDMKLILSGMLEPTIREEITGHAEVRQVIKITNVGNVAGSFVTDGELSRNNKVRLIRDGVVIYTGEVGALKRFKDDAKEVKQGFECGISIEGYNDVKEKDVLEGFRIVEEKRSL
ncbi:MAG: translation initiation factor IF-2 [Rickettsiales bacterium]|nr:translation initiation factor IF-2 [Rickettsiales bacterium]